MITNQVIQETIEEVHAIAKSEFMVKDSVGSTVAATKGASDTDRAIVLSFVQSQADTQEMKGKLLLKIYDEDQLLYVLIAEKGDDLFVIGKILAAQISRLIVAYKDRIDRNSFYQNLLMDNLLLVDIYNRAQKLHIEAVQPRCVFLIEPCKKRDNETLEMVQELFYSQAGDFVTAIDESRIIVIKALESDDDKETIDETARMLVDMLGSEAMESVRVSFGTVVGDIKGVSKSFKEAKMALDVGKIFYPEKTIIAYDSLGIGRLIYQLPVNLCQLFINEIFGDDIPEEIDDEIMMTVNKFLENSLNVSETSRQLYIHRNTLVYRIEKLQKVTGLDIRNFDDAMTLKIALMVVNYIHFQKEQGM